jgi:alcohol/geraniol dehydrogenase (NADP+)
MEITGFAASAPKQKLTPITYTQDLLPHSVFIKITHSSICHSDLSMIDGEWEPNYPVVAGHEIVGTVEQLGDQVSNLKKGDRVGVGWQSTACLSCKQCLMGWDNLCQNQEDVMVDRHGGFADHIVVDSRFAYKIPEALLSSEAAPLLCAGITVYQPMRTYGVVAPMKVGVIGIGGLGHLAIQFAKAFGCEVYAFSESKEKESDANKFGADHFHTDIYEESLNSSLDFIIDTAPSRIDWKRYMAILAPLGKLCVVGVPEDDIVINASDLITGQKSIVGGSEGSRAHMVEMLEFAALHNIKPQVEVMKMSEINQALEHVRQGKARYRVVLEN